MALAQLNGVDVLEAQICMPSQGAWHADVVVDSANLGFLSSQTPAQLVIGGSSGLVLVGTAMRFGAYVGTALLRMIGGGGGLGLVQAPKSFQQCTAALPLTDTLTAAGEELDPSSDAANLDVGLTQWMRCGEPTSAVLDALVALVPGSVWRVLPGGTIWLGTDMWPAVDLPGQVLDYDPQASRVHLGVDVPQLFPGLSILGRNAVYVVHEIKAGRVMSIVNLD